MYERKLESYKLFTTESKKFNSLILGPGGEQNHFLKVKNTELGTYREYIPYAKILTVLTKITILFKLETQKAPT